MPDLPVSGFPSSDVDSLMGHSLITGEALASEMRAEFFRATIRGKRKFEPLYAILDAIKRTAAKLTPILAESFWGSDLSAWLSAYQWNADRLPNWLKQHLAEANDFRGGGGDPPRNIIGSMFNDDDLPERIVFPQIQKAASSLMQRGVLPKDEFESLSRNAKAKAFTVAGDIETETIERIRDMLSELVDDGPSLPKFREQLSEKLETGSLGPARIETIYRTNIQAAYRDGRESLMQNPIVSSVFPYQEYLPIYDSRVEPEDAALGSLGLNGTGIYRRDDPFWDLWTPPIHFNCRCGTNLLTIEAAARKGVKEAQEWLRTGVEPPDPEYRFSFIPFQPKPGFGARHGELVT